jgi:hypothetical protein
VGKRCVINIWNGAFPENGQVIFMKHLKSSVGDLRGLFARAIALRDIAEPLASFDHREPATEVRAFMEQRGYDVVGLRESGVVTGYVARTELAEDAAGKFHRAFTASDMLPDSEPLLAAFEALREKRHIFITVFGHVGGIVTRGDLQKAPVRLWLFGLVSLLEMQLLRVVRVRYPTEAWTPQISGERLEGARRVFAERQRRKEELDLSDCLQLGDKAAIFMKDAELFVLSGFASRQSLEDFFKEIGALRNGLAHANDILSGRWPALADLIVQLEIFLARLEAVV